jgi:hypothetical protein
MGACYIITPVNRFLGILLVLVLAAAFGSLAIFGRYAYAAGLDTATLLFLRFSLSAALTANLQGGQWVGVILAINGAVICAVYIVVGAGVMQQVSAVQSSTIIFIAAVAVYAGLADHAGRLVAGGGDRDGGEGDPGDDLPGRAEVHQPGRRFAAIDPGAGGDSVPGGGGIAHPPAGVVRCVAR